MITRCTVCRELWCTTAHLELCERSQHVASNHICIDKVRKKGKDDMRTKIQHKILVALGSIEISWCQNNISEDGMLIAAVLQRSKASLSIGYVVTH